MDTATIETKGIAPRALSYEEERGKPMPSYNHSWVQSNIIGEFLGNKDYRVHSELTLDIQGRRYTPDISLYPRSAPIDLRHDVIAQTQPPLLVVEILSPEQGSHDVMQKLDIYFAHGVKSCWVVTPPAHALSIYLPDGATKHFTTGTATDPVLGVSVDVDAVFS
jgi:Uma2 family endonuclease